MSALAFFALMAVAAVGEILRRRVEKRLRNIRAVRADAAELRSTSQSLRVSVLSDEVTRKSAVAFTQERQLG
ncbi:hypothetical protein [Caulobacter segnis]|uniref:Uncharacterized protein n=1 Tax=Caulobacter segnis TaxID=88688 RepID=A0A2W5WQQ6_9CAUL|nr:hypothetical protein [Caulobacter segnis]PZR36468.1 MAG: hypothetical protein DI526_03250 [Caulobacter segnis]